MTFDVKCETKMHFSLSIDTDSHSPKSDSLQFHSFSLSGLGGWVIMERTCFISPVSAT